jgi:C1A family cysteine protease
MAIYEDVSLAASTGVFQAENCKGNKCKSPQGGHAVLAIGLKSKGISITDPIDAFVVKNSWGDRRGLNSQGMPGWSGQDEGYFLISSSYLDLAANQVLGKGWSILVAKKYLPK